MRMAKPSGFASWQKKASLVGAFFVGAFWQCAALALCPSPIAAATYKVAQVVDGDTLRLGNGRSVRLIGINAPELGHAGRASEPYAEAARRRLAALVEANGGVVGLVRGAEARDRYGRLLAHAYGRDGDNLQARLLREGLGYHTAIAPNGRFATCLAQAEQAARRARLGLWQGSPVLPARSLRRSGFALVKGRVTQVRRSNGAVSLLLDDTLRVRLPARLLRSAPRGLMDNLEGRTLEVRGWITRTRQAPGTASGKLRWQVLVSNWNMLERAPG
ncbi:thermonuclease family protein [Pseudomonas sp. UBA6562]|uniref:thermonuclease family protein n=1 Tax=Pseudomonas sp. UBA6562 TaxID=1947332 RepID=UPI0025F1827C|nr:thermonuclease family protein [Pseudomonas sp. UBA6562]